jgi:hypothetical protein
MQSKASSSKHKQGTASKNKHKEATAITTQA